MARAYFAFCRPYASFPQYLVLGETRRPPEVTSAPQEVWFWRQDAAGKPLKPGGPKLSKVTATLPSVTAGTFAAADGSLGTILVNATERPQKVLVRPDRVGHPAALYCADRTVLQRWPALPASLQLEFEPFGSRMLIVQ